jgi:hypothetical protein
MVVLGKLAIGPWFVMVESLLTNWGLPQSMRTLWPTFGKRARVL